MTFSDLFKGAEIRSYNGTVFTCYLVYGGNFIVTEPHMSYARARTEDNKTILEQTRKWWKFSIWAATACIRVLKHTPIQIIQRRCEYTNRANPTASECISKSTSIGRKTVFRLSLQLSSSEAPQGK